eukprot:scaffold2069_cov254-Pinguiococcus_pyrenoidosus.AAC.12
MACVPPAQKSSPLLGNAGFPSVPEALAFEHFCFGNELGFASSLDAEEKAKNAYHELAGAAGHPHRERLPRRIRGRQHTSRGVQHLKLRLISHSFTSILAWRVAQTSTVPLVEAIGEPPSMIWRPPTSSSRVQVGVKKVGTAVAQPTTAARAHTLAIFAIPASGAEETISVRRPQILRRCSKSLQSPLTFG